MRISQPGVTERLGHVGEWCAVAQLTGLPLQQWDLVLPVVAGLPDVAQPAVPGHHLVVGHLHHCSRVQPRTDHLAVQIARHPKFDTISDFPTPLTAHKPIQIKRLGG